MSGLRRESKQWRGLYKRRVPVEGVTTRVKDYLLGDELTIRGIAKGRMHPGLWLLVMVAGAREMVWAQRVGDARWVVR